MRFRAAIRQTDTTATGIVVPDEVVAALGAGKRPPVRSRSTASPTAHRGGHGRRVHGRSQRENRAGAKVAGGDEVDIDIELDTAPRVK